MRTTRFALALAGLAALPAVAATDNLTSGAGQWVSVFAVPVEHSMGASMRVDRASVANTGLGRTFRQAQILLAPRGQYPRGTTVFSRRSVDCAGGRMVTTQWRVLGPTGATLASSTGPSPIAPIVWNSFDGRVLHYVCSGALSR